MTRYSRRDALRIGGGAGLLLLGGTATVSADDDEGDGEAGLRVAHASPNAPNVDVFVDDTEVLSDVPFRTVSDYLELAAGEYDIRVEDAANTLTVFDATVELAAEDYTAVALGEVFNDDTELTVSIFQDTNGANIDDDEARVRAIHASPDAPAVDVTVNDDALTLFEDFEFGESSGYAVVDAGKYDVELRPATGGDPVTSANVTLEGGATYTIFAEGYLTPDDEPADEPLELVPIQDKSAPPRGDGKGNGDDEENGDEGDRGRGRDRDRGNDD
jgi:hypothetical protein